MGDLSPVVLGIAGITTAALLALVARIRFGLSRGDDGPADHGLD